MEKDQNFIRGRIEEVLKKGYLFTLGTVDEGGVWVSEVNYVADENMNIYWLSVTDVRHSTAIHANGKVAGVITISNSTAEKNFGVQIEGVAEKIEGNDVRVMKLYFDKKQQASPSDESFLKGKAWYVVRPTMIELIDGQNFGFKKQKLELK